jgi:hypothetical protein
MTTASMVKPGVRRSERKRELEVHAARYAGRLPGQGY